MYNLFLIEHHSSGNDKTGLLNFFIKIMFLKMTGYKNRKNS